MTSCNCCGEIASTPVFAFGEFRLVRCTGCSLTFIGNPPDSAGIERLYDDADTDYHAELRDPASVQYRRIARTAANHLRFVRKVAGAGRLVDIGCSTGQFLGLAAGDGFDCAGVELSASSAAFAAETTGVGIEHGTIHATRHEAESCDVLTMFDVIEHVPDPARDIAAAWQLLRPGGWLVLSTPNIDGLFPRASYPLAGALNYWPHPEPPHHLYQFSVDTLRALLATQGFEAGPVEHHNIELSYTFGAPATLLRMPKRLAYAALFAPMAKLGPMIGQGDWFYIAARKPLAAAKAA